MNALLLACALLAAAEFGGADLKGLKEQAAGLGQSQGKMAQERAALRERFLEGLDVFKLAGIERGQLLERFWQPQHVADGGEAIKAASLAIKKLYEKHPSAVADAYNCKYMGGGVGALTNMEESFKALGGGNLERGCLSHQAVTMGAIKPGSLEVRKIMYGKGLEHHAVIMYPKGEDWKHSGIVLDAWLCQRWQPDKMVYLYKDWAGLGLTVRLED